MTRAAAVGVSLAVVAGCATGRAAVAFDLVARREAARGAQLRVDDGGRPYLIVRDAIVPLAKLPSGADANPFRVAGADPIGDLAWTAEGVPLLVVGAQLGTLSEHGFAAFLALPEPGMRAVPAAADRLWLFAPRAADGGRLYLYTRAGGLALVVRAAEPIHAASGTPDHAFAAIGSSIVRFSSSGSAELAFDAGEPIVALAAVAATGVAFSTGHGTFFLGDDGATTRISKLGASAIEARGDDVYFVFDAIGIVHASPATVLAALPDVAERRVVSAPPPPAPFTPEDPSRPPPPAPFDFPDARDFRDLRLVAFTTSTGDYSAPANSGSTTGGAALHIERTASSGFPGFAWSIGLDLDFASGDLVKPRTTLYSMTAQLAFGYGVALGHYVQVELMPYGEVVSDAIDHPFSDQIAWGSGGGLGARLQALYTMDSGIQVGLAVDYGVRWLHLAGSCDGCTTSGGFVVSSYDASVTTSAANIGLVVGKRY